MEMLRSFRGDKHEFCLAVIMLKHVRSCPSFDITYMTCLIALDQMCVFLLMMLKYIKVFTH